MIKHMQFSGNAIFLFVAIFVMPCFSSAGTLNFIIQGGYFADEQGQRLVQADPVENSAIFQLINLGPNGVFDPAPAGSWVGGDDVLMDVVFDSNTGESAAAFALGGFSKFSGLQGFLSRSFGLPETPGVVVAGDPVGLRWYPGMTIAQFNSGQTPQTGTYHGEVRLGEKLSYPNNAEYSAWELPPVPPPGTLPTKFDPPVSPDYQTDNQNLVVTPGFTGSANMQFGVVVPIPFFVPLASALVAVGSVFIRRRNHTRRH